MRATRSANLNIIDSIIVAMVGKECKLKFLIMRSPSASGYFLF